MPDPKSPQVRENEPDEYAERERNSEVDPESRQQSKRDDDADEYEVDEDDIAEDIDLDDLAAMEGPDA
jgi:hypothetical protein